MHVRPIGVFSSGIRIGKFSVTIDADTERARRLQLCPDNRHFLID
jgi:hypothetical protein